MFVNRSNEEKKRVRRKTVNFLHLSLFLSTDYTLCSKISKLFYTREIEMLLVLFFDFSFFSNFLKVQGFILLLTAYCINSWYSMNKLQQDVFR